MTPKHSRSIRLGVLVLAVTLAGLAVGPTNLIASDLTEDGTAAAASDDVVHVDETFRHDPGPDGNVTVELRVPAEEIVDGAEIRLAYFDANVTVERTTNFERDSSGDGWLMQDTGEQAVLTYRLELDTEEGFVYSNATWASFDVYEDASTWVDGSIDYEYDRHFPDGGIHHPKDDVEWTIVGDVHVEQRTVGDGATISVVVPNSVDIYPEPTYVADQLQEVTARRDLGTVNDSVVGLAIPEPLAAGYGYKNKFVAGAPAGFRGTGSVWFHEYFHTLDPVIDNDGENMTWYSEAYASWGGQLSMVQQGHNDFDTFRTMMDKGRDRNETLAEQESSTAGINYVRGPLVLLAIDRQIRAATDGNRTYDAVARQMEAAYTVDLDEYLQIVATVANQTVANRSERWIRTTEDPEQWGLEAHQEAFGPATQLETTVTTERVAGGDARPVDLDADPDFYTNQTLRVNYSVTNVGDLTSMQTVSTSLGSLDGDRTVLDETTSVAVASDETRTVSHAATFPQPDAYVLDYADDEEGLSVPGLDPVNGSVPTDPDGDGRYEDINRNGRLDFDDVVQFDDHYTDDSVQDHAPAYDFDGDGDVDVDDAEALFYEV